MRRAFQLIPFSRFHKRVLFIGESCKTDGARFSGYPTSLLERIGQLKGFADLLLLHLDHLEQITSNFSELISERQTVLTNHSAIRDLMKDMLGENPSEHQLNELGLELVSHIRYVERTVFQRIQTVASENELNEMLRLAEKARFYEMHQL